MKTLSGQSPEPKIAARKMVEAARAGDLNLAVGMIVAAAEGQHASGFEAELRGAIMATWPEADTEAIEYWQAMVGSNDPELVLYNLAVALWGVGELLVAVHAMRMVLDGGDLSIEPMLGEAELFLGDFVLGQKHLAAALQGDSQGDVRLGGVLARSLFRDSAQTGESVLALLEVAAISDHSFAVDLAELLLARGEAHRAKEILSKQAGMGNVEAPIVLGNLLMDVERDFAEAERAYLRGIELGDAHSAFNLAGLLVELGRLEESGEWLRYAASHGDERAVSRLSQHPK